jgi:hypothetical protein
MYHGRAAALSAAAPSALAGLFPMVAAAAAPARAAATEERAATAAEEEEEAKGETREEEEEEEEEEEAGGEEDANAAPHGGQGSRFEERGSAILEMADTFEVKNKE